MRSWLTRAGVATVVLASATGAMAQTRAAAAKPAATDKTWSISRTPWGDPDLQEIWSTEDLRDIPYERPDALAGRASLTDEEFAARRAQAERAASRAQSGFATNFTNKTSVVRNGYGPHNSRALRLIERFTRVSQDQIDYQVLVNDSETWTRPFTMAFPLTTHPGYQLFPYECHEGNLMLVQALSGARAEDRAEAEAIKSGLPPNLRTPVWEAPEGVQVPR